MNNPPSMYCFAHFITDGRGSAEALALYRAHYRPSARNPEPHGALCVWALAAETEAEAARLFSSHEAWRLGRDRGIFLPLPSPEEAAARDYTEEEQARIMRLRERAIYGTASVVADKLRSLAEAHTVSEIAILTTVHEPEARKRSYALLAEEFQLTAPTECPVALPG